MSEKHVRSGAAPKEYTLRLESIAALAQAGAQEEVLAEVALLKQLPIMMDPERVASLPPLLATFRDERSLCWIFQGRALCTLHQLSAHARLDEEAVQFVLACVVTALECLHRQSILLRSVASPLLMVNDHGYVVVVDLRHSRRLDEELSYSMSGLPQYLAPEQVRGEGHSFAVDWWALGVLLYELACGQEPFHAPAQDEADGALVGAAELSGPRVDELEVARMILQHAEGQLFFVSCHVSEMMQELITALLHPEPDKRMGAPAVGAGGAAEVKDQPPPLGFEFGQLEKGTLQSPLAARAANVLKSSSTPEAADGEAVAPDFAMAPPASKEWVASFEAGARHKADTRGPPSI